MQFYQFLSQFQPRSRRGEWRCIEPINFPQIKINFIDPIKPIENVRTAIDRKRDVHSWTFPGTNTDCVDKALLQKHHQLCVVWMHFSGSLYFWHSRPCIVHVEFDKQPKHGAAPWYMSSRTKSDLTSRGLFSTKKNRYFQFHSIEQSARLEQLVGVIRSCRNCRLDVSRIRPVTKLRSEQERLLFLF